MPQNPTNLHHTRAEIQGTIQMLFSEGALSLADYNLKGAEDGGNFLGAEIKADPKREPVLAASRGVVIQRGSTPGLITLGLELMTKEVADARKLRYLLSAAAGVDLAQAALAAQAFDAMVFSGPAPAVLNRWYPILKNGTVVREISAVVIAAPAGLIEGTDYVLDKKLGLVRFIKVATLPTVNVTGTVSAPVIDAAAAGFMKGLVPMQKSSWSGWARFLVWDQDPGSNLVMDYEPRPVELTLVGGSTVAHDKQSELKIMAAFTSNEQRVLHRD
jgi:hypothetical protein